MRAPGSLWFGVVYLLLYVAGAWLLDGHPLPRAIFGNLGLLGAPLLVCAIILRRRRTWTGCHRLFWDTFGIGVGLWAIGHVGFAYDEIVLGRVSWLEWHTVFSLCGGICPLIALLARPHRGARPESAGTAGLVLASYGLLCVFVYAYFVMVPSLVRGQEEANYALLSLVQVNRAVLFLATAAALYYAWNTRWRATYACLTMATGLGLALRFATNLAILRGTYHTGTVYDLAWIAPYLLYAQSVAVAPSTADDGHPAGTTATGIHAWIAALPVLLIPVLGYGILLTYPQGEADAFRSLLTGLMTVAGLGLLTLRLASQGSELQRADARLRLLAAATEQTADLIMITRADGAFEHANDAFVRALGYSRRELATLSSSDLMEGSFDNLGRCISAQVRERGIWRGTLVRRCRDGSTFPASCTIVGLKNDAGRITHYVGVERDITEELKLRDQLVHSERLSAIGELVAGVAHEINNPLQTIVGSVELMMEERDRVPSRRDLEVVRREATRAGQIVRNLLSFVRRSAPDRATADLNDIVRATVVLRDFHLHQRNVSLTLDLQPEPLPILANREEIQQIVLNVLLNAEHAVLASGLGGAIVIRTRREDQRCFVEIADDGPGVSPEHRGRIFEPFFTTKEVGEGTGLGLSISHGIASAHGGSLELRDAAKGACFRLSLPVQPAAGQGVGPAGNGEAEASPYGAAVGRTSRFAGNGEAEASPYAGPRHGEGEASPYKEDDAPRALVIDDEPPIRALLVKLLERRGFRVAAADTGESALAMNHRDQLRVVLCDVRMPGVSGFELYERLTSQTPALASRFVFITGDGASIAADRPDLRDVPVLAKPFSASDLDALLTRLSQPR